jgi:hypothetical protein
MNDDQSPLVTLISCMVCAKTMKLETIAPYGEGNDLIKYRCGQCGRIERLRWARRSWPYALRPPVHGGEFYCDLHPDEER